MVARADQPDSPKNKKKRRNFNTNTESESQEKMESNLIRLLDSQHLDEVTSEICDFTLEEQNQFAESQGVKPSAPSDYVPVLGAKRE